MTDSRPHIVIIGGGFAGLWATRALAKVNVRITLLDRGNHHLFQPLLYQVATAGLSAPEISAPLRHILRRQKNVTVLMEWVSAVDADNNCVRLADGRTLGYDYAVLAAGATHSYFGNDAWAAHAPGLKSLDDALDIRRRLLSAFEKAESCHDDAEREALMSFAIVGAGPTGVELAGTLAEIARRTLPGEFRRIDPRQTRVLLVEAGKRVLPALPENLSQRAAEQLQRLGVEVRTGQAVDAIDAEGIQIGDTHIPARTVIWAAGVAASPLGEGLDVPRDKAGRVQVQPDLSVPGHANVFVAGDLARLDIDGEQVPGVAAAAKQMGTYAARAILARIAGKPLADFQYRDYGSMSTIGRKAAVVKFGRWQFSGAPAWWFWLWAHIFFLIGFRNRLVVLFHWTVAYWTHQRSARVILGREPPEPD